MSPHPPLPPRAPEPHELSRAPRPPRTLGDRFGADTGLVLKCASWGLYVFGVALFGGLLVGGGRALPFVLLGGGAAALLVGAVAWTIASGAGAGFRAFVQPSGSSTPYREQYSYEESLAARGDVPGALAAYEARIAAAPHEIELRVRAAELYAGEGRDAARAAAHLRELRAIPGVSRERMLYASHRLVDLYEGPLGDRGRALVELRRLVETFPGSAEARHARDAIRRLKADEA